MAMVAGLTIGLVGSVEAQSRIPVSIEARFEAAVPRGAVAERWGPTVGVGLNAAVQLVPNYALYAGYSRASFDLDPVDDMHAVDSGFSAGLTRTLPVSGTAVVPWVKSGLLIHSLEIEGGARTGGDGRLGFEVGGGITIPNRRRPALPMSLGASYRRYGARVLGADREAVSYFSAGLGLIVAF